MPRACWLGVLVLQQVRRHSLDIFRVTQIPHTTHRKYTRTSIYVPRWTLAEVPCRSTHRKGEAVAFRVSLRLDFMRQPRLRIGHGYSGA